MRTFCFSMVGSPVPLMLDVPAADIVELEQLLSVRRFISGRAAEPNEDGVLVGVLIATGRVQCASEV